MSKYYTVPPAGLDPRYGYNTSASTSPAPEYDYYDPNYYARGSPSRSKRGAGIDPRHVRTASYSAPRVSTWQGQSPWGGQPVYYTASPSPRYTSPSAGTKYDHVSSSPLDPRQRRASMSGRRPGIDVEIGRDGRPSTSSTKRRSNSMRLPTRRIFVDAYDDSSSDNWDWDQPIIQNVQPRKSSTAAKSMPPPKKKEAAKANIFSRKQTDADTPVRSRARRNSTSTTTRPKTAPAPVTTKSPRAPAAATSADAARHKIPAGYVLKNWDPTERPVLLLGSVFDANSLGKWIYDWTVYTHDAGSPLAEMAGELWLMLIKFSHKMKRAEEGTGRVRGRDNRQMLADFQESGDRLWRRLLNLLKVCEDFMWRVAKRAGGRAQMGERSGVEFVKTIFGRDRELEETERLMSSVRLWIMRFDANCEDLLRSRKH